MLFFSVLVACNKEDAVKTGEKEINYKAQMMDYETYLELKKTEVPDKSIRVEHATWEELNEALVEAGHDPLPKNYARSSCPDVEDCYLWDQWGDWSGNSVLSTQDVVMALNYICSYPGAGGCSGSINIWDGGNHPYAAYDFAGMTNLCEDGNELDILNRDGDCYVASEYIIGRVTCDP